MQSRTAFGPASLREAGAVSLLVAAFGAIGCESPAPSEPASAAAVAAATQAADKATVKVFATGLKSPRGFVFGGRNLYVAEAGSGGSAATTASECQQVGTPPGPYTNGRTARISRIGPNGNRSTFASGFPSALSATGDLDGVADVAFVGSQLYALVPGGGCSHGSRNVPASVVKVSSSGQWAIVADLSAYLKAHPVAHPPGDFEPDGTWFSMRPIHGILFAVEPNHGEVVRIDPATGQVRRVADFSAKLGHIVPTALAERSGNLFFGNLGTFPITPGNQKVWSLARNGDVDVVKGGFTTVLGLDFDSRGRMYVLETSHAPGFPTPGTGRVVRINSDGTRTVIVNGLVFPTAMRFGPDGKLYISNKGFGPQPGEILQVDVPGVTPAAVAAR
jgi:hypothetical protein